MLTAKRYYSSGFSIYGTALQSNRMSDFLLLCMVQDGISQIPQKHRMSACLDSEHPESCVKQGDALGLNYFPRVKYCILGWSDN